MNDKAIVVDYPTWLSNMVMVKKAIDKWQTYVDFVDLNKVCPKDYNPPPWIDALIVSSVGNTMMNFLNVFSRYHQIQLCEMDKIHTSF